MITEIFVAISATGIIGFDIIMALKQTKNPKTFKTISRLVWDSAKKYPMVPFAIGILCGHLFWQG